MGEGTKQDKDVPNGVIMGLFVVGKEVSSCGIGDALGQEEPEGDGRQELYHGFGNEDDAPAHDEIDGERESRPAVYREDFIESAGYHQEPQEREHRPAQPSAHDADEDGRVGTSYHDVDADVIALAESALQTPLANPMIDGTAEEHEEHAEEETGDAEGHLPADVGREPDKPDAAQGEDGSGKVRPNVSPLPAPLFGECIMLALAHFAKRDTSRLHLVSFASISRM